MRKKLKVNLTDYHNIAYLINNRLFQDGWGNKNLPTIQSPLQMVLYGIGERLIKKLLNKRINATGKNQKDFIWTPQYDELGFLKLFFQSLNPKDLSSSTLSTREKILNQIR